MNVLPATVNPPLAPQFDSPKDVAAQKAHQSFGQILAATAQASGGIDAKKPAPLVPDAMIDGALAPVSGLRAALRDDPAVEIGEDAVRFDARPLLVHSSGFEASAGASRPVGVAPTGLELVAENAELQPELQRALARIAPHFEAKRLGRAVWTASTLLVGRFSVAAKGAVTPAGETQAPLRAGPPPVPEGADPADHSTPADSAKAEIRTEISLALAGDEVLVTVRGVELTADEEEALAGELRGLLASTDFGGRALRVVTSRRT